MRMTKKYEDGSYGLADWVINENSYEFKNSIIQRLGKFEDHEENFCIDLRQQHSRERALYNSGRRDGRNEIRNEIKSILRLDD